jgi:DNA ligase-1
MPDLADGESIEMQGSGSKPYVLKNVGGVYSCTCPAWRNQSLAIEKRTCKHLQKLRGVEAEQGRVGGAVPVRAKEPKEDSDGPPLLLAERWDGVANLAGWWMSEKLDGVRAYWTGKEFLSRQGNRYHAPDWFVAGLPDVPLDGELWLGRKMFQRAVSIVRRQDKSDLWKEIRFVIFDAPGVDREFEARLEFVQQSIKKHRPPHAEAHAHNPCKDIDHLRQELLRIEALGGEGLMLRQPGSKYHVGRSLTLLKVKTFHDAEARVVGHEPGAGRHKGRLGALQVEMADGTKFSVGTGFSDAERDRPPAVGSTITFRYQELSDAGVPRFPSFVGVRAEMSVPAPAAAVPAKKAPPKKEVVKAAAPATGTTRRFEFAEGNSNKFWEIAVAGSDVTVCFGRIGSNGQTQSKSFADAVAATRHADKLILEKTEKGYNEVHGE